MAERIDQSVSYLVVFRAYLASDGKTPATGKTIAITISKNGGAFGNPNAGATNATEISSGFYKFTLDTTDTGTLGPLAWRGAQADINDAGDVLTVADPLVAANVTHFGGSAGTFSGGRPEVNASHWGGTAVGSANVRADLRQILGTAPTEGGAGRLAGAFTTLLDVAAPVLTAASVNQTGDSYARIGATGSGLTSLAPASTALSTAQWTNGRAGNLDNLDAAISTRSTYAGADTAGTTTLLSRVGTPSDLGGGATVAQNLADIESQTDDIGAAGAGLTAIPDAAGVTTLLGRLTASRAGYLDNLNVGGAVASQADINALNQSASRRVLLTTVGQYERPESGNSTYTVEARTYDGDGAAADADSTPSLAAAGIVTGDLSANLSAATNPATGVYRWAYTVANNATIEQIRFDLSATIGGGTHPMTVYTQVADFVSTTFTAADRTKIEAIYDKLPSKTYLAGTANSDGDVQLDEATGTSADSAGVGTLLTRLSSTRASNLDNLDAAVSTRSTYAGADTSGTTTLLSRLTSQRATNLDNLDAAITTRATPTQVNTEVDAALADIRLDELLAADSDIDGAAPPAVGSVFFELLSATTGSFTFDQTTDSLEALRNRGDAAWLTATGFSTHSAADVWAVGSRTLTAFGFSVTVGTNNDKTGYALATPPPTADEVADAVWEETLTDHSGTSGSTAAALNAAGSAGDPWATALPGAYGAGTAGNILGNRLDVAVGTRSTYAGADTAGTTTLLSRLSVQRANNLDNLDAAVSSRSSHAAADVWSVGARTLTAFGFNVTVGGYAAGQDPATLLDTRLDALDSALAAIDAVTDKLDTTLVLDGSVYQFTVNALELAPVGEGGGGGGVSLAQLQAELDARNADATHLGRLDETISSRSVYAGADTAGTTTLMSRLTALRAASLDNLDALVSSRLPALSYTAPDNAALLAVKARTDNLPDDPAAASDVAAVPAAVWEHGTRTLTAFGLQVTVGGYAAGQDPATLLDARLDALDGAVAGIVAVTDKLDTAMQLDGSVYRFTANALEMAPAGGEGGGGATVQAIWEYEDRSLTANGLSLVLAESGVDVRQAISLILAMTAGEIEGADTSTPLVKEATGAQPRVEMTTDEAGNRSGITYTPYELEG